MSRTTDHDTSSTCSNTTGASAPPQSFSYKALPENFHSDMEDELRGMGDALQSMDFLESLIDPLMLSGQPMFELDREGLSAYLRIVNGHFFTRLTAAQNVLDKLPKEPVMPE